MAIGAIRALRDHGLRVPEDVSGLGYDNVPFAACYSPALTTVEQPLYEMGKAATRRLIAMIEGRMPTGNAAEIYPPRIILRDSVKCR